MSEHDAQVWTAIATVGTVAVGILALLLTAWQTRQAARRQERDTAAALRREREQRARDPERALAALDREQVLVLARLHPLPREGPAQSPFP